MKFHPPMVFIAFVMFTASVAFGRMWDAPCPAQCPYRWGESDETTVPVDLDEAEYACCINGACRVCDACPWYLELWC